MFDFQSKEGVFNYDNEVWLYSSFNPKWIKEEFNIDPKVIFEFGSYDGGDGLRYKLEYPDSKVYSIEALPSLFTKVKRAEKYGVNVFNYAIHNSIGVSKFYPVLNSYNFSDECAGSLLKATEQYKNINKQFQYLPPIEVPTITIKQFCLNNNIDSIDFMQIDVEGSVIEVIEGFEDIRPKLIFTELQSTESNYIGASNIEKTIKLLEKMGYYLVITNGTDSIFKLR